MSRHVRGHLFTQTPECPQRVQALVPQRYEIRVLANVVVGKLSLDGRQVFIGGAVQFVDSFTLSTHSLKPSISPRVQNREEQLGRFLRYRVGGILSRTLVFFSTLILQNWCRSPTLCFNSLDLDVSAHPQRAARVGARDTD